MLEHGPAGLAVAREPVVEVVLERELDLAAGIGRHEPVLGLALELRVRGEQREQHAGAAQQVVGGDLGDLLGAGQLAIGAERAEQRVAQRLLVRAAERRRHGVAIEAGVGLLVERPGDRPFDPARAAVELRLADERQLGDAFAPGERRLEEVLEAGREMEHLALGHALSAGEQLRIALPADLDPAVEIGLAARHAVHQRGAEAQPLAEDLRIGAEADHGAAAVGGAADQLELARRLAADEALAPELAVARDLDDQLLGERVDDRHPDPMQAARGLVDLGAELAARVQRGHDHLERRAVGELGVRIDRDAAAIVAHRDRAVGLEPDLDPVGVAGDRLVHGVVEQLGDQVVQRALVGAADEHGGPPAHRLETLEHLDVGGRVVGGGGGPPLVLVEIVHGRLYAFPVE